MSTLNPQTNSSDDLPAITRIPTDHLDLIHDMKYDFYGQRLAICGSDSFVTIWDRTSSNKWIPTAKFKPHRGKTWRCDWAHPEFGQILATCSFDRRVAIFSQVSVVDPLADAIQSSFPSGKSGSKGISNTSLSTSSHWENRAYIQEHHASVDVLEFAPHHHGLLLATGCRDRHVRIFQALALLKLSNWSLYADIVLPSAPTAISFNPSRFEHLSFALSCINSNSISLYYELSSSANTRGQKSSKGGSGSPEAKLTKICEIVGHRGPVYDLAWAPSFGKSYHLLASCGQDATVRLWKIWYTSPSSTSTKTHAPLLTPSSSSVAPIKHVDASRSLGTDAFFDLSLALPQKAVITPETVHYQEIARFTDHSSPVWKVEFNALGTLLSSSGDDGCVRVYQNVKGVWTQLVTYVAPRVVKATQLSAASLSTPETSEQSDASAPSFVSPDYINSSKSHQIPVPTMVVHP